MKIGMMLAYYPWFTPAEQLELSELGDRLGMETVWIAEGYGQDATAILGLLAGRTERITLGAAIMSIPARQPTATGTAAATLDQISQGRFILGLGLSGPQVSEGWYGVPFTAPLERTAEYIEIVRKSLSRKPVEHNGKHWSIPLLHGGIGQGKPIKMMGGAVQDRIPIYLGVTGPRTVEQAGQIADGWLPTFFNPEDTDGPAASLYKGIEKAGRSRDDVKITPVIPCAVHDDVAVARDQVRPMLAMYLGGMGSREKNFYVDLAERYGHGVTARACRDLFLGGDIRAAQACLTDDIIDCLTIATTPRALDGRLQAFEHAGVHELAVVPFGDRPALLKTLAAAFGTDASV
ncbi:LLM class flavin-dependent oxidoreductase [Mycolicibacterium sp.]|uniref:LLM class flavin-dependent oxidoreductase n=1 Tax=Mycolicibacterium sp. TaxID=2320850 RepID=UPI003D130141